MFTARNWLIVMIASIFAIPASAYEVIDLPELRKRLQSACPKVWEPNYSRLIYINGQETATEPGVLYSSGMDLWHSNPKDKARYISYAYKQLVPNSNGLTIDYASADGSIIVACSSARSDYFRTLVQARTEEVAFFDLNTVRDDDHDGVFNNLDQCLETSNDGVPDAEDYTVNAQGCAAWEVDADGDEVSDHFDLCPNTPLGAAVDSRDGCKDTDLDGESDRVDPYPYQNDTMCFDPDA